MSIEAHQLHDLKTPSPDKAPSFLPIDWQLKSNTSCNC